MKLSVTVNLNYRLPAPTDMLLQFEAATMADQTVTRSATEMNQTERLARVQAEAGVGERIWLRAERDFSCAYNAEISIERAAPDLAVVPATAPQDLPGDTVPYLMPSRHCPSEDFTNFVMAEFGSLKGGARIAAMRDWIGRTLNYVPGASNASTTALESFVQRQGVCRDYAHVLISLARASAIPARFVSAYAPRVSPPDFHAVAEVFLDGAWHLVDPTGMATPDEIARIGVGADASHVPFMMTYAPAEFVAQSIFVTRVS